MRAIALLGVFVTAKLLVLSGRPVPISGWSPIAYFWEDILVALVFALVDRIVNRAWFGWSLYVVAVAYVTINVPIARLLSSPLTWSMLNAAGAALSDSIRRHVTPANIALMLTVVGAAVAIPLALRRLRWKPAIALAIPAALVVACGPMATSRLETVGLGRNPIMALATTALPRTSLRTAGSETNEDFRAGHAGTMASVEDLSHLSGAARGRNVVLILLESAGAEYLKIYGSAEDPMPSIGALANQALIFDRGYAVYPESIKEFFSVLCSRYPAMDIATENYAGIETPTLASLLRGAGYRTALFHSGRFMYLGMYAVVADRGYEVLEDAGAIGGNYESSFGIDERSAVRRTLEWIDSLPRSQPFFLTYLPIAGHHPYDSPEPGPFPEASERDRYLNALHYSDSTLGELFNGLRSRGLFDNTLFVIFGDHGQAFGQHQGNFGHSLFLYEENIRVPYLIVAPGMIESETRVGRAISVVDTAPTVLDLLGLASPAEFQGRTALEAAERAALFFTDYSLTLMGMRDGCWKYIYELDSGRSKLFDLCEDPSESADLSGSNADLVSFYRDRLLRWSAVQKSLMAAQSGNPHSNRKMQ